MKLTKLKQLIVLSSIALLSSINGYSNTTTDLPQQDGIIVTAPNQEDLFGIKIRWSIARNSCVRKGSDCSCGFGLCEPDVVPMDGFRAAQVNIFLLDGKQTMRFKFESDIDALRDGENTFVLGKDLILPTNISTAFGVTSITLLKGNYAYDTTTKEVIVNVTTN